MPLLHQANNAGLHSRIPAPLAGGAETGSSSLILSPAGTEQTEPTVPAAMPIKRVDAAYTSVR
jgi:hypothetical protein